VRRNQSASSVNRYSFYWIGVVMAVACFVLAFASNTALVARFATAGIPLSWMAGAVAIIAFLAYEFSDSEPAISSETEYPVAVFEEAEEVA